MSEIITLYHNDKEYKLEFSRNVIMAMESQGFDIQSVEKKLVTAVVMLIRGAFKKNHPQLKFEKIDEIWDDQGDKEELIKELFDMFTKSVTSLFDSAEKKATWTKSG